MLALRAAAGSALAAAGCQMFAAAGEAVAPQKPEGAAGLSGEPSADCAAESPCMTATEIGKFVTKLLAALLFRRFIEPALEAAAGARWPASRQCKARSSKPRPTLYSKVGFGPVGRPLPARSALTPQKILLLYNYPSPSTRVQLLYNGLQPHADSRCGAERFAWSADGIEQMFSQGKGCDHISLLPLCTRESDDLLQHGCRPTIRFRSLACARTRAWPTLKQRTAASVRIAHDDPPRRAVQHVLTLSLRCLLCLSRKTIQQRSTIQT